MPVNVWQDGELQPPVIPAGITALPIGAVLVVSNAEELDSVRAEALVDMAEQNPWVPVVGALCDVSRLRALIDRRAAILGAWFELRSNTTRFAESLDRLVASDLHSTDDLLRYTTLRLGGMRSGMIRQMLTGQDGPRPSPSLGETMYLPTREWWRVLQRQLKAQSLAAMKGIPETEMAKELYLSPETLSAECRSIFGLSWVESSALHWRARIERAFGVKGLEAGEERRSVPRPEPGTELRRPMVGF